jgi:maleylpyruvate isomerase
MKDVARAGELARVARERTQCLLATLAELDEVTLNGPSQLPGWSRLTIICHLRYGAHALRRMTVDALAGRRTSYYPDGRAQQRPTTLVPAPGERPADVLENWRSTATALDSTWSTLDDVQWRTAVIEPADNPDLGTVPLGRLALARLTEVEVHATDLGLDAPDWSTALVEVGLPTRLAWLANRRTNHRVFDRSIRGSWLLNATDGQRWLVAVDHDRVESRLAAEDEIADATIDGSNRDLLALLLGRPRLAPLRFGGDVAFAQTFVRAFPGP